MEKVTLTMNELKREYILKQIIEGKLSGIEGARRLDISIRQMRRIISSYRNAGVLAVIHGNRGRQPNNKIKEEIRQTILDYAKKEFLDYNDSHFTDELNDLGITVSRSTVRRIRRENGYKSPRKHHQPKHRSRRKRVIQAGMLLQTDGSKHDWLEGRGPQLVLIAYIDDATNEVMGAIFRQQEDAAGYFLGLKDICLTKGIPQAIYADQHTIFQGLKRSSGEDFSDRETSTSYFGTLLKDLGIELKAARSPQAKGRIERLWGTLQDRLIKDLRKANATTLEEANLVLRWFIPKYNHQFQFKPEQEDSQFVPLNNTFNPDHLFCFKYTRKVANDNTISLNNNKLQIQPGRIRSSFAKAKVDVWQQLDGRLQIKFRGELLATYHHHPDVPIRVGFFVPAPDQLLFTPDTKQTVKEISVSKENVKPRVPSPNHPWRNYPKTNPQEISHVNRDNS
jgi:transposase